MTPSSILTFSYLVRALLLLLISTCLIASLCYALRLETWSASQIGRQEVGHRYELLEAITLGNSHNRAIDFDTLGIIGMHMYEGGGDLREAEWKLKKVLPLLPKLQTVFIAYSPGMLQMDVRHLPGAQDRLKQLKRNIPYYRSTITVKQLIEEMFPVFEIRKIIKISIGKSVFAQRFRVLKYPAREVACENRLTEIPYRQNLVSANHQTLLGTDCIKLFATRVAKIHNNLISQTQVHFPNIAEESRQRLVAMAKILKEKGIDLVLYRPPYTPQYRGALRRNDDIIFGLQLAAQFCNVQFVDLSNSFDSSMAMNVNHYFYDADHLALVGAKTFTRKLGETLRDAEESRPVCPQKRSDSKNLSDVPRRQNGT